MNSVDKVNILLVDDRPENLLAIEAIIDRKDYHLVKASSGEEALRYLLKNDFAAILLDVQMPGIDGFATAKIIKAREKTKNIPILFITANNLDSEHIFKGYSIGAIDYILKPFDPVVLKAKVEGFVQMYRMNQLLVQQANHLEEKTKELEKVNIELSKATSRLQISEALANVITDTSIDTMINIDDKGIILKANPAISSMFGYEVKEILNNNILDLFKREDSQRYIQNVLNAVHHLDFISGNENKKEIYASRKDGTIFPTEVQVGKRFVKDECIVAVTIRDITDKKQYEERITHMAYYDWLTDLPNRRLLNEQLPLLVNQAKQFNQSLALFYLDMDRFKYINDSLGHLIGDKVLQEVAVRLKASVRETDLIARVGGDEFNIVMPNTNRESALELAENILESFKRPLIIDQYELFITSCIGMSIFPFDGEDTITLMKNADVALYRAKELGNNKCKMYHTGLNIQSYKSFILKNDLRKAIQRKELALVYQPRINIESGEIKSAEALLRWNHPTWGIVSPMDFIPLAEESGQIVEIGEWVLKEVCKQIKQWEQKDMPPIRVAVNFSSIQFLQKDLVEKIESILNDYHIEPRMIEVEITESVLMGDEASITRTLTLLRNLGIWISLDDFGTGYSSLNYLRQFPLQTLKIDKSFIKDLTKSISESVPLVSTIISLAKSLKMSVIAEGVETEEQLSILRDLNCHEIQGYLVSPPIIPKEFEQFLKEQNSTYNEKKELIQSREDTLTEKYEEISTNNHAVDNERSNKEILTAALNNTKDIYMISIREMDVFKLLVDGLSNKEISERLFISEHTVKNHITRIFQKLTVNDRVQAIAKVYQACIEQGKNLPIH